MSDLPSIDGRRLRRKFEAMLKDIEGSVMCIASRIHLGTFERNGRIFELQIVATSNPAEFIEPCKPKKEK